MEGAGKTILVTGGAGFIGSHTCVCLLERGWRVVVVDSLVNSCDESLKRVAELAHLSPLDACKYTAEALKGTRCVCWERLEFFQADLCDAAALERVFSLAGPFEGVIHFAGLKAVGESVAQPLRYYENNLVGTFALLRAMERHACLRLIFSSSATVYGLATHCPVAEDFSPLGCTNPYGRTKLFIEDILRDWVHATPAATVVLLRYFNPVGAHPSGRIGEDPRGIPNNLMPFVAKVAAGKLPCVKVFGNDYPTPDGTGVRDYIHVCDLAEGHIAATLKFATPGVHVYNLGVGRGYSVLEMIAAMSKACGHQVPYQIVGRREGDVAELTSDPSKAERELGWKAKRGIEEMCADIWRWQSANPDGYDSK